MRRNAAPDWITVRIVIVGGFSEVIELCLSANREICGVIDRQPVDPAGSAPYLGDDAVASSVRSRFPDAGIVLSPDLPDARERLYEYYSKLGFEFPQVFHPLARISASSRIGVGVTLQSGSCVSSDVRLGDFVRLNFDALVTHDCSVGDYTTIAPRAVLLGRVSVGARCYIGANATILPMVRVHAESIVGAGAVVTKDVPARSIVKGNPGRVYPRDTRD